MEQMAFVPVGTTGESPTLSMTSMCTIETCVKAVNKKASVIGVRGLIIQMKPLTLLSTQHQLELMRLVVTPYYNKPTQEGMYQHFINDISGIPIII